ncbi:hypothetical protein CKO42_18160 [Lamprobacter modestohalophilus]|uniref:Restriction endonuclease type IV Mrr domain-containing protein n=1 Tax=Lamprobacter modestohalophilus TaxID=1064514 RepID=A0A9X0WCA5_9GAMM|nr:hypothetical protein [Lamprobacter modestohalophilus]
MDWSSYEKTVAGIYKALGKESGVNIICSGRNCKVLGKSGVCHQVDVLTDHSVGVHVYKTAIECKFRERKRSKDDVTKLAEIIEDARIHKGVIVSKNGFTEDAIAFAQYKNIDLMELRAPTQKDWEGRIKDIQIRGRIHMPIVENVNLLLLEGESGVGLIDAEETIIQEPNAEEITLSNLMQYMISSSDHSGRDPVILRKEFKDDTEIHSRVTQTSTKPKELYFSLRYETDGHETLIKGEDHVTLLLMSTLGEGRFVISPDGNIRKSDV